jgi:hypothetical protein
LETYIIEEEIPQEECNEEAPLASQTPLFIALEPKWIYTYRLSQDHLGLIFDKQWDTELAHHP